MNRKMGLLPCMDVMGSLSKKADCYMGLHGWILMIRMGKKYTQMYMNFFKAQFGRHIFLNWDFDGGSFIDVCYLIVCSFRDLSYVHIGQSDKVQAMPMSRIRTKEVFVCIVVSPKVMDYKCFCWS